MIFFMGARRYPLPAARPGVFPALVRIMGTFCSKVSP